MENTSPQLASLILPLIFYLTTGLVAYMLAKEKGRNVALWTMLGLIPACNIILIFYFAGATNLRVEKKIDKLLSITGKEV